jgi:hypothetical protein
MKVSARITQLLELDHVERRDKSSTLVLEKDNVRVVIKSQGPLEITIESTQ